MKIKLTFLVSLLFLSNTISNAQTSLNFDGSNDYITGTNNASLHLTQGTIEAWIKTNDAGSNYRGILVKQYAYGIFLESNKVMIFEWGSGQKFYPNPDINLADGNWHHIAFSFNSNVENGSKIYVDGVLKATFKYRVTSPTLNPIAVGNGKANSTTYQFFNGDIDDVRVWNTVRTESEIISNYNKCLTGNETGLVMYLNFEEGSGATVSDLSGNSNDGSLTNMDTNTAWVSGYNCEPQDLVAYYPFNGNANDESGNSLDGTVNGASLTTDRFGNPDSAYSFDGNDNITIAHDDILNVSGELSFSVWVKPNFQQNAMILGKSNYSSSTNYLLRTKSTGYIQFEYKEFANSNSLPLIVNDWNHIAVVSQNDNSKQIYINGVLASHTTDTSPYGLVNDVFTIGSRPGAEFFNGSIDDLRMYKSALSESDILNLYNNNALNILDQHNTNNYFYIYNNSLHFNEHQNLSEIKHVFIYNLLAQEVMKSSEIQLEMPLNFLDKGVYILKVENINGLITTRKFVIQ
jgi:hypothetical protein